MTFKSRLYPAYILKSHTLEDLRVHRWEVKRLLLLNKVWFWQEMQENVLQIYPSQKFD